MTPRDDAVRTVQRAMRMLMVPPGTLPSVGHADTCACLKPVQVIHGMIPPNLPCSCGLVQAVNGLVEMQLGLEKMGLLPERP